MSSLIEQAAAAVHLLSAAAWFGALVYRAFFVDPRATRFFAPAEHERFALHLADGMRYVVLAALLACGLSGFALLGLRWNPSAPGWLTLMGLKAGVWAAAFAVFAYISWVYWPRRVFAVSSEYGAIRRQGLGLALVMIAFAGLGMVLGQVGQALR
jgi:hypothetical protein